MTTPSLILYVKIGCPWCHLAENYLRKHGYRYTAIEVRLNRMAFEELQRVSGQTLTPTLAVGDLVLRDFGPEELEEFLKEHNLQP
jgi:glutaredoxin 3